MTLNKEVKFSEDGDADNTINILPSLRASQEPKKGETQFAANIQDTMKTQQITPNVVTKV